METGLEVGQVLPPEQAEALEHRPVFRHVQPGQAGQVGARQPGHRLLPPQVRLDENRPAPDGRRAGTPDDPALTGYWDQRRRRARLPVDPATWHLLRRQRGGCPLCRGLLLHADHQLQGPGEWQQWHTATRKAIRKHAIACVMNPGTPDERAAHHLMLIYCRRRISSGTQPSPPARQRAPRACLSRAARKAGTAGY